MNKLEHIVSHAQSLRPSIAHYFLLNLEKYVEENNLKYYKDFKNLYKFKNIEHVAETLAQFGKVVNTPIGMYVEVENGMLVIDVSVDDQDIGLYTHMEFFFNKDFDLALNEKHIKTKLESFECKETITRVLWQFKTKDYIDSVSIYEVNNVEIHDEAYPYIEGGVDNYIQRFIESDETVLIMIGPAGTGKTKLIKYIMKYMSNLESQVSGVTKNDPYDDETIFNKKIFSVAYSTSQETYNDDEFFIDFVRSDNKLLVLEDIDYNLRARTDGNTFMHKLLNASDGIIELKKKKFIITTNLENEQKTDKALLRPGRTFDVLKTRHLNFDEAVKLAEVIGTKLTIQKDDNKYSLAEIYNSKVEKAYTMSFR